MYNVVQSKLFITSLFITEYSISDIKLLGTDLFPLKFPLYNRIFTMCQTILSSVQGFLNEQVSVSLDKWKALCILMQCEIELMNTIGIIAL